MIYYLQQNGSMAPENLCKWATLGDEKQEVQIAKNSYTYFDFHDIKLSTG